MHVLTQHASFTEAKGSASGCTVIYTTSLPPHPPPPPSCSPRSAPAPRAALFPRGRSQVVVVIRLTLQYAGDAAAENVEGWSVLGSGRPAR